MIPIKLPFAVFLVFVSSGLCAQTTLSKGEVTSDLEFLKTQLVEYHPGLRTYSSTEAVNEWFDIQIAALPDSLSRSEAYEIVSLFSSVLKDGHSYIYPTTKHLEAFFNGSPLFPLDVFPAEDGLAVVGNYSEEGDIPLGSILTHVNGVEVAEMETFVVERTSRDGDNLGYPKHLFSKFFPAYHSYFYGFHKEYTISLIDNEGITKSTTIKGLTRAEIKTKRPDEEGSGITLKFIPEAQAAVLSIASFDKKILKDDFDQKFKKEVREAFLLLQSNGVENLAIDLRGNQGGNLSNGVYLLKQFMDSSFQCVDHFNRVKKGEIKTVRSAWDDFIKPAKKYNFSGNVFLFINGGSFSCSAIVANTFKENKRGIIIGEMTGGSAYINSGAPDRIVVLPNTQISFTIPRTQYCLRERVDEIGLGVVPDIPLLDEASRMYTDSDNFIKRFVELCDE
jgi:hypothetical protein